MPHKLPPWSYSFISSYDICPRMAHGKYILKYKDPETIQTKHGNEVHKALEKYVAEGEPLRAEYRHWEPLAASIKSLKDRGATIEVERKLGVSEDLQPRGFFEAGVYGRGVVDILTISGDTAWIGDWKTGKVKENDFQVGVFAALVFTNYPAIRRISANNIWLQSGRPGVQYDYRREGLPFLWATILPKIQRMELSAARDHWPERRSGLCGWCPVKECKHNPKREK